MPDWTLNELPRGHHGQWSYVAGQSPWGDTPYQRQHNPGNVQAPASLTPSQAIIFRMNRGDTQAIAIFQSFRQRLIGQGGGFFEDQDVPDLRLEQHAEDLYAESAQERPTDQSGVNTRPLGPTLLRRVPVQLRRQRSQSAQVAQPGLVSQVPVSPTPASPISPEPIPGFLGPAMNRSTGIQQVEVVPPPPPDNEEKEQDGEGSDDESEDDCLPTNSSPAVVSDDNPVHLAGKAKRLKVPDYLQNSAPSPKEEGHSSWGHDASVDGGEHWSGKK
jgi:hypothetical protein